MHDGAISRYCERPAKILGHEARGLLDKVRELEQGIFAYLRRQGP